jgi:hypothetical protein
MRHAAPFTLLAVTIFASGVASAEIGLPHGRTGLGLKPEARGVADWAFGNEAAQVWQARGSSDYALYGGARDLPQTAFRSTESYTGIAHALTGGWGVSFEAGYVAETPLAPRRYSLTGQLHTALSDGRMLSVGLKYRVYDTDTTQRNGTGADATIGSGYTLAPYRVPGAVLAPSYQLQFSYQYSTASTFGMALGRDLETFTPYFELPGSGPRQFTLMGRYSLTPSWALSYDLLSQDATSPLRLQGLRLGVRYRF